jgi:Flp pilus assembly protein TadD
MLALYPPAIFFDSIIQKAGLGLLWTVLLLLALAGVQARPKLWKAAGAGAALGLLMLTREETILLTPVLLGWLWWKCRDSGIAGRLRVGLAFAAALAATLAPVAVRNYKVGGEFVLTTAQAGPNFYIGNNPSATGIYAPLRPGRSNTSFERQDAVELAEQAAGRKLSASEVSNYWTGRALQFIRSEPAAWLTLMARKAALLVNAYEVPDAENQYFYEEFTPFLRALSRVWHFGILFPLAVVAVLMIRGRRRHATALFVVLATLGAAGILFYVFGRYRYTLVPPLMLLAGAGVVEAASLVQARRWRALVAPCAAAVVSAAVANWPLYARTHFFAESYSNAGAAVAEAGDDRRAIGLYGEALRLNPNLPDTICNLAAAEARLARMDEAVGHMREALRLRPDDPRIEMRLGTVLAETGHTAEAIEHLRRAVELGPADVDSRSNYMLLSLRLGRWPEALEQVRAIAGLRPEDPLALSDAAWMLATCPDVSLRDGNAAVAAAEKAVRIGGWDNPELLDILAAAYAQAGRFDDAVATATRARDLANALKQAELVEQIESHLASYRERRGLPD